MDNFTHSLIGVLVGETLARMAPVPREGLPPQTRRDLLVVAGVLASNLPDIDLLYSFFGSKVNYLLHHRGHTHTIIGAALLSALCFAGARFWLRCRNSKPSSSDLRWLALVVALAPMLHLAMDATNNYGVHPFWPWYEGWFYGDSVFIAEPLLWAACAPLLFLLRTLLARTLFALLLAAGTVLGHLSGLLPAAILAAYLAILAGMLALGRWAKTRTAIAAALCVWIGTTVTFVSAGRLAGRGAEAIAAAQFPHSRLLDRVLTPMPANPLCWEVLFVQDEREHVVLRRAVLALAPAWMSAAQCGSRGLSKPSTAPLTTVERASNPRLQWFGQIATPTDRLLAAIDAHCEAAAAIRFIRAPWLASVELTAARTNEPGAGPQRRHTEPDREHSYDGRDDDIADRPSRARQRPESAHQDVSSVALGDVLGDLRYDRERKLGFAEIELSAAPRCPALVPAWRPPRADVLSQRS